MIPYVRDTLSASFIIWWNFSVMLLPEDRCAAKHDAAIQYDIAPTLRENALQSICKRRGLVTISYIIDIMVLA